MPLEEKSMIFLPSTEWKVSISIISLCWMVMSVWLCLSLILNNTTHEIAGIIVFSLVGVGGVFLSIYSFFFVHTSRIEVSADKIQKINIFRRNEMLMEELSGFRISGGSMQILELESSKHDKKNIRAYMMFENNSDLISWLTENSKDLNKQEDENEIRFFDKLTDQDKVRFRAGTKWANTSLVLSCTVSFWALLYPTPYREVVSLLIISPFLSILMAIYFSGLIMFDEKINRLGRILGASFLQSTFILLYRSYHDWNIMSWKPFWTPYVVITALTIAIILLFVKDIRSTITGSVICIATIALFCYGVTISINGIYDKSKPIVVRTKVINKEISSGKSTQYYVTVEDSEGFHFNEQVRVSRRQFEACKIDQVINVRVHKGAFGIPFFFI
jgi:hypothetical protein